MARGALDLHALTGPLAGQTWRLSSGRPLPIGRGRTGISLPDPLVSLRHAEVVNHNGVYTVVDLDSETGTWVDGQRITEPASIREGTTVRVGETCLQVRQRPLQSWVGPLVGGLVGTLILGLFVVYVASQPIDYRPTLPWPDPIHIAPGQVSSGLALDVDFVRQVGVDQRSRELRLMNVTDGNGDGIDEVWISARDREHVFTFSSTGAWEKLGVVPQGCRHRDGSTFDDLDCDHETWRYDGTSYRPFEQEGVVGWMTSGVDADGETWTGPPRPYRFTLAREGDLEEFLARRGVQEPIHYLICEEAIPGLAAQVLLESGEVVKLEPGCIREVRLEGPDRRHQFGTATPVALALTATGTQALLEDVATFMGGSVDTMFLDEEALETRTALRSKPNIRLGRERVVFEGSAPTGSGSAVGVRPIAREQALQGPRLLYPSSGGKPAPVAVTATLLSEGTTSIDALGCGAIELRTGPFQCAINKLCVASKPFLTVVRTGCEGAPDQQLLQLPYSGGFVGGGGNRKLQDGQLVQVDDVAVRAMVESVGDWRQVDVLRARVSLRRTDGEPRLSPLE